MKSSQYLPAVDGLRAVAVLLTFFFRIYPGYLPGGFVGVDVFFAISGFLITSILVRETSANGVRALSKFYARRALRILPALVVCVAVTFLFLPSTLHQSPGLNAAAANVSFVEIQTDQGHDSFLLDIPDYHRTLTGFLNGAAAHRGLIGK